MSYDEWLEEHQSDPVVEPVVSAETTALYMAIPITEIEPEKEVIDTTLIGGEYIENTVTLEDTNGN